MSELWSILIFQGPYTTNLVLMGTTTLGLASGIVGSFALLRRRALVADALAHATLPGIAIAFLLAIALGWDPKSLPLLLTGATVSGVLGVLSVHVLTRRARLSEDAAMAAVLSVYFGAGAVLLTVIQKLQVSGQAGLSRFILGSTAAMSAADVQLMAIVCVLAIMTCVLLFKELRLICFDRAFASVQGWPVTPIDLLLMALVTLVTVAGLQAVGLVLVIALLITPAAAARIWSHKLSVMVPLAGALGAISGWLGSGISATYRDASAGAVIVLTASGVFVVSMLIAPRRGVLASFIRAARARLTISQHHLLRAIYEQLETNQTIAPATPVPNATLRKARHWPALDWSLARTLLRWRGLITTSADATTLSEAGLVEAQRLVRAHRLWEQYLISRGGHDALHADLPADLIEHALDPVLVARLEREIAAREIPASPHPLTPGASR